MWSNASAVFLQTYFHPWSDQQTFSICFVRNQFTAQRAKYSLLGSLNAARMNIERGPVIDDIILCRRHGDHAYFGMLPKQNIANQRPFFRMVESDDHEIRVRSIHALGNLRLFRDFTDNFYVGLVGKGRENGFAHKARAIRHEYPDGLFHGHAPCEMS